ncbi:MAG: hypothetical protein JW731_05385 [Bacteroidales bacterium]|nr:hypothetical protein [Bacteroidales bacterium]
MKSIEEKIRKNKELFNDREPDSGHLDRFREKLDRFHREEKESWFQRYNMALKIAAALILFVAIVTLIYTDSFTFIRNMVSEKIIAAELPVEVREVMQYYNVITDKKVAQIDQLASSETEATKIKEMALSELNELNQDKIFLENEYARNPENERVLNALLVNQQKRAEVLDKIINMLNQIK